MIFFDNFYSKDIRKIEIILNEIENEPIRNFYSYKTRDSVETLLEFSSLCNEIKNVKDFFLFRKIFQNTKDRNQRQRFEYSIKTGCV